MPERLTLAQALRGELPPPMTREAWHAMHQAARQDTRCTHVWTPWVSHATGRVRFCPSCRLTSAEPVAAVDSALQGTPD